MTTLFMLGSGSSGNALAIEADGEVLLVDAGFSAREMRRRSAEAGLDLRRTRGLVLTHEHGDHSYGAARLARLLGIPILTANGTRDRLLPRMPHATFQPVEIMGGVTLGNFHIETCHTSHDAAEPIAVSVRTSPGHRIGIAYDFGRPTAAVRFLLRESHALVLEANHDEIMLRTSEYPAVVQERIAGSSGHLSNRAAAQLIRELVHAGLGAVVLAHLSERCNTPDIARQAIAEVLEEEGCCAELHIALQDRPLPAIRLTHPEPSFS
jgi:phosphoribosyl 1,2-cyclic phosphodiesterase